MESTDTEATQVTDVEAVQALSNGNGAPMADKGLQVGISEIYSYYSDTRRPFY